MKRPAPKDARRPRPAPRPPAHAPVRAASLPIAIHPARDAVMAHVTRQAERFPLLDIRPLVTPPGLPARDAALAHAISDALTRRWLTLAYLLNTRLDQPIEALEPPLRAALLVGSAQLIFLDRVPAYAAIDHAVQWAKVHIRPGAAKMTNAVLRRIADLRGPDDAPRVPYSNTRDKIPLDNGQGVRLTSALLPATDVLRVACACSVPIDLLQHWSVTLGIDAARKQALHTLVNPPTVLNVQHAEPSTLPGPELLSPHGVEGCRVFMGTREQLQELLGQREDLWVQDAGACGGVRSIADLRPGLVIDLCAGQGTKTRQLCATFPQAHIIATDTDERRRAILGAVFKNRRQVRVKTPAEVLRDHAHSADLIVLDVPCSNTGVLSRRAEAKYRFSDKSVADLVGIQHSIVNIAMDLLSDRPGAGLLYSTCSIDPRENQDVRVWACERRGLIASRERAELPAGLPGEAPAHYRDGAYSVLLRRG